MLSHRIIVDCTRCPRLTIYRQEIAKEKVKRFKYWEYWGRQILGFGDPQSRIYVLGLAPVTHGGNRTGRVFTGDRRGDCLYEAFHADGFANQPTSVHRDDGRTLQNCYVAAAVLLGPLKKAASSVRAIFRAHVLEVRSARKNGCGLAGRTFLNRPENSDRQGIPASTGS